MIIKKFVKLDKKKAGHGEKNIFFLNDGLRTQVEGMYYVLNTYSHIYMKYWITQNSLSLTWNRCLLLIINRILKQYVAWFGIVNPFVPFVDVEMILDFGRKPEKAHTHTHRESMPTTLKGLGSNHGPSYYHHVVQYHLILCFLCWADWLLLAAACWGTAGGRRCRPAWIIPRHALGV